MNSQVETKAARIWSQRQWTEPTAETIEANLEEISRGQTDAGSCVVGYDKGSGLQHGFQFLTLATARKKQNQISFFKTPSTCSG